jgi:hypothetical protein
MNVMQIKREIREGVTHLMRGVTTTMMRKKGLGAAAPLMGCCPLLLYKVAPPTLFLKTLNLSIPYLVAPPWLLLKRSATKIVSVGGMTPGRVKRLERYKVSG